MNASALLYGLPSPRRAINRDYVFVALCVFIGVVSIYDAKLVIDNQYIQDMERNPVCLQLIQVDANGCSAFLCAKGLGTAGVLTVLLLLYRFRPSIVHHVALAVGAFQAGLLIYLTLNWPYLEIMVPFQVKRILGA